MIVRSKAPLRIGLAGGGTDVSPYSDIYGGAILNATVSMYAYATIEPTNDGKIVFDSLDRKLQVEYNSLEELEIDNSAFDLFKGIYNRIIKDYVKKPLSFKLSTYVDAPPGSGMGTSSTLVTAIVGAFTEWLKLPLGEYDIAWLAFLVERVDLNMAGGKQDQYAATFGGVNYMEFYADNKVIVNPLRIKTKYLNELAYNIVLYYTETSRSSAAIIEKQQVNVRSKNEQSIESMHQLKLGAVKMKEFLLKGDLNSIGHLLDESWRYKKQIASGITNSAIDSIYDTAMDAGALGGKISGAGGGGFMFFYCPGETRHKVIDALSNDFGGQVKRYQFTKNGLASWTV